MKDLKTTAGIYYLAVAIGYVERSNVVKWADFCIEHLEVPYEFIELSLSGSKSIKDTLSILKTIYRTIEFDNPMRIMLSLIRSDFLKQKITEDEFFTYIFRLYEHGCMTDKAVTEFSFLDHLSDGYYLATEGIYGNKEDVVQEALEDLEKYEKLITPFEGLFIDE
ncbi:hypothetical protein [Gorillibacterium massiliense]|uniref:hypothetical protein n=1 Tax=Gorillibacterium massiliense TaxID=1280390 RepID=UPI00059479CA|nr:hypothetical protein [Gorillibacterium massiliense]